MSEKHSRNKAKRQQNPIPFSQHKNITGFPFWNDFIEIIKYNNSVTDMQTIYIYTPLVKQAMSLRKFIKIFVFDRPKEYLQVCPSEVLTPSSGNMRRL